MKTFAAVDVGSYELCMKIFEYSKKNGMRVLEEVRVRLDLGTDSYTTGKISPEKLDDMCRVLNEFQQIMKLYHVDDYRVYGTSAIRETKNTRILLDQIKQRTGMKMNVLSNSEQRFLDYKAFAIKGEEFAEIIGKGTAILDIGGGSIQLSLFDKDKLVATQNMRLGVLRLQEGVKRMDIRPSEMEQVVDELVEDQFSVFEKLYLKDREIKNIIIVDDYLATIVPKRSDKFGKAAEYLSVKECRGFLEELRGHSAYEIAEKFDISLEHAELLFYAALLVKHTFRIMKAEHLWAPGVSLCDGIGYEYAEKNKLVHKQHDFEQDIIASARNISKRYMGSKKRGETMESISLNVFDSMKKVHGLEKRDRLLLQIAAILHDCGKYISLTNLGESSYQIIMATEIIGLSHREREIIAQVVRFNHLEFRYNEEKDQLMSDLQTYLRIAKLTAILRVANGLDKSHKQKFKDVRMQLKEHQLLISIGQDANIALEKGMFAERARFFEEVFSVEPVIVQR